MLLCGMLLPRCGFGLTDGDSNRINLAVGFCLFVYFLHDVFDDKLDKCILCICIGMELV